MLCPLETPAHESNHDLPLFGKLLTHTPTRKGTLTLLRLPLDIWGVAS